MAGVVGSIHSNGFERSNLATFIFSSQPWPWMTLTPKRKEPCSMTSHVNDLERSALVAFIFYTRPWRSNRINSGPREFPAKTRVLTFAVKGGTKIWCQISCQRRRSLSRSIKAWRRANTTILWSHPAAVRAETRTGSDWAAQRSVCKRKHAETT